MRCLSCLCPRCRTVCHCSRPSCSRHARRLPGHSIAGAHRMRAPPEESPPDGTVSGAYPTLGGRAPAWVGALHSDRRGRFVPSRTPIAPGGAGGAAAFKIRVQGQRAQRRGEPAPLGRPEARRTAAAGSPSVRPDPAAVSAEPRARPGSPAPASARRPCAPAASQGRARRPLVEGAPSERRLSTLRCAPAGRTFVSARRLLSPPSVNHSWSPGEEGRPEMRGLLKGQHAFSGLRPPPPPPRRPSRRR